MYLDRAIANIAISRNGNAHLGTFGVHGLLDEVLGTTSTYPTSHLSLAFDT
jgi:hypothetical protein